MRDAPEFKWIERSKIPEAQKFQTKFEKIIRISDEPILIFNSLDYRFLRKLRLKQRENYVIDSIADILVEFFSASSSLKLKSAYGELFKACNGPVFSFPLAQTVVNYRNGRFIV